jgi:hypothetical protein
MEIILSALTLRCHALRVSKSLSCSLRWCADDQVWELPFQALDAIHRHFIILFDDENRSDRNELSITTFLEAFSLDKQNALKRHEGDVCS